MPEDQYFLYTLNDQDQIVRVEEFDGTMLSIYWEYEYDSKGNVIKETYFDGETKEVKWATSYQYDDHPNPHHALGFFISDNGLFSPMSISPNNIIKISDEDPNQPIDEFEYDYDTQGNPVKMYFHNHYIHQEYDSWGQPVSDPEEKTTTYGLDIAYQCQ